MQRAELPQLQGGEPRATEVIGIPLPQRGYHVVEVESRILGHALLAQRAPMYVRTGALVTNLGVHFKRGRSSSLVWVTTLDRGRPVAGARVAVNDCRGRLLWSGSTDAQGMARIERGFDEADNDSDEEPAASAAKATSSPRGWATTCPSSSAPGTAASSPGASTCPLAGGTTPDRRAHTVFDRTLLRAGETVSMKHFVREETERGLALPARRHAARRGGAHARGQRHEFVLPLAWPPGRAARAPPRAAG